MLVNRANITSLIDRMEKAGLVARTSAPTDRRYNIIVLTSYGKKLLSRIEPLYAKEVQRIMDVLLENEQKRLIGMLEKIRSNITEKVIA
jgi:DNA-binding MarR family transcriptional regulator